MKTARTIVLLLLILLLLAMFPWGIPAAYLQTLGIVVEGEVVAKREAIVTTRNDYWQHVFEVTYRYVPHDSGQVETGMHRVDPALFSRLQVGAPVRVRYSPWRALRKFNLYGSVLADSSWLSRLPRQSDDLQSAVGLGLAVAAVVLVGRWYMRRGTLLGLAAATAAATALSSLLLLGVLVFPLLFLAWRRSPGRGAGWVLLASVMLSSGVIALRIPWPTPTPPAPTLDVSAKVNQVRVVTHIWGNRRATGQALRKPYQLVDMEFTPAGARESVHAVDQVDLDSVPGLTAGATIQVTYPLSNPRAGRITRASRTYAKHALMDIFGLTYGLGSLLTLAGWPLVKLAGKWSAVFGRRAAGSSGAIDEHFSRLPADDPRRTSLGDFMRSRRKAGQRRRSRDS